ncbi:MAG: TIGR02996 domain-containing protein [Planctomycetes bacterium]|nr:TIGR02996 domain-containing protein [Planctomycetota bacterium]
MTSDGDALFRAICEHPREDTPRLVYADWLQENGLPERAEFIRLQCEAWALCPAYPTLTAARTRASDLLRAFGDRWYNELPFVPGLEWGDLFVRGFIDSARTVAMSDVGATLEGAFAAAPLRFLTVTELRRGQLRLLLTCPRLGQLTKLYLPGTSGDAEYHELEAASKRFPNTEIV